MLAKPVALTVGAWLLLAVPTIADEPVPLEFVEFLGLLVEDEEAWVDPLLAERLLSEAITPAPAEAEDNEALAEVER